MSVNKLAEKKCVPCSGGTPPMKGNDIEEMKQNIHADWQVIDEHHLARVFKFKDFAEALDFTNQIGALAEEQGHHPDIFLSYGKVKVELCTHKIDGLSESDFIMAAKIDQIYAGG
jgi:4a-hydroxytetrahydrobiopterin dehydratase